MFKYYYKNGIMPLKKQDEYENLSKQNLHGNT